MLLVLYITKYFLLLLLLLFITCEAFSGKGMRSGELLGNVKAFFCGVKWFCAVGGTVFVIADNIGYPTNVIESSMQPTINNTAKEDWIFVNRWSVRNYDIQNGDIVVFRRPDRHKENYIKRVVANEGECIRTKSDEYLTLPKGHCWVEGDNIKHSIDSNYFGAVPKGLIYGKATHIVWPPNRWKKLESKVINANRGPVRPPLISEIGL